MSKFDYGKLVRDELQRLRDELKDARAQIEVLRAELRARNDDHAATYARLLELRACEADANARKNNWVVTEASSSAPPLRKRP